MANFILVGCCRPWINAPRFNRFEARHGECWGCREKHEVAGFQVNGFLTIHRQEAFPFHDRREARVSEIWIANSPLAGAADAFGHHGAGLKQGDDF
jgi:hypothetical protein